MSDSGECLRRRTPGGSSRVGVYRRRRPERSVLYEAVRQDLETWLARSREACPDDDPIPAWVEEEFRRYLTCGILAHGFARARCPACGHDFLVAFSCKGRGVCPSCNTRRMAETAAHLVDHVFPQVPVRQWVLSFPKRLRYFLHRDPGLVGRVLAVALRTLEPRLRECSPGARAGARFGAVTFIQRFGSALNAHLHFHICVIDGVFSQGAAGELRFHPATVLSPSDVATVQRLVRHRVLRLFERDGLLSPEATDNMREWRHGGGFSLDASVAIEADDRAGLERLLRYCSRPAFSVERLSWRVEGERVVYRLPKSRPDGTQHVELAVSELFDRLAALIPPPRRHRHRYHGVLAPNAALRRAVTTRAGQPIDMGTSQPHTVAATGACDACEPRRASYLWAALIARIYECLPLSCPSCGAEMRLIAFLTDPASVKPILVHLGLPAEPPRVAPARDPPLDDFDQTSAFDPADPVPEPEYEFDQSVSW